MDIKSYIESVLIEQEEPEAVVIEIYKTGSYLFKDTPKDLDYVVICTGYSQRFSTHNVLIEDVRYDFFIFDTSAIAAQQDFSDKYYIPTYLKMYAYTTQIRDSVYGRYEHSWDMLDHELEYKRYLKETYLNDKTSIVRGTSYRPGKFYVNYYIILKIYENNIAEINEDMISEVTFLYDTKSDTTPTKQWVIDQLNMIEVI
jgi:hypothetical protein